MDMLCTLAIYMLVLICGLICVSLTLFTSVVLYECLVAAYDVVCDWIQNLEWKRRCARRKKK